MHSRSEGDLWPGAMFIGLWWMIATYTPFQGEAFLLAMALMVIAWAGYRAFMRACLRLEDRAPVLLGQMMAIAAAIILLHPAPWGLSVFWIWFLGPPLVIAGAYARPIVERHKLPPEIEWKYATRLMLFVVVICTASAGSFGSGFFLSAAVWLALYYGWQFGEPRAGYAHDARMGSESTFEDAGVSRER
jgi:hypothetical protein